MLTFVATGMQAFTSDVGEAARPVVHPRLVTASYGVSWLYCIGDVVHHTLEANSRGASRRETLEIATEKA
jgi:mitochondrial fission process protein 1